MTKQKAYSEKRFREYYEDDLSITLRNKGGSYGGGQRGAYRVICADVIRSLCASDCKGAGSQYVMEGKLIIEVWDENIQPDKSERNI